MIKLRVYFRFIRLLLVMVIGSALAAGLSLAERLCKHDLMNTRQRLTQVFLARLAAALPFEFEVSGALPKEPMLWVSNHVSWTDIPLLGMLTPLSFLSKAEVRTWPVAGWLADKAGTLFIQRGSGQNDRLNQQLGNHLKQGRSLLIFPEGTTTDGLALRTFHGRLLSSAIDNGVSIQPVAIRYQRNNQPCEIAPFVGDEDMFTHLLRLLRSDIGKVQIQLLKPINSYGSTRNELARNAQQAIAQALYSPQPLPPIVTQTEA